MRKARSPEEYQDILQTSLVQIERLCNQAVQLLFLARFDSGKCEWSHEEVDLTERCREMCNEMMPVAQAKRIVLQSDLREPYIVRGDKELLHTMLLNLLDNAIKYARPGGKICLSLVSADQHAVLNISDTGIGISPEDLPYL